MNFMAYWIRRFNAAVKRISNIPSLNRINPTFHVGPIHLASHLYLRLHGGLFPVGILANVLKAFLRASSHSGYMPCLHQTFRLNHLDCISWTVQTLSSSLWYILPSRFACLLNQNTRLSGLFLSTFTLCFSLNIRNRISEL